MRAEATLELTLKLSNVITEFLILLLKLAFCDHRGRLSEVGENKGEKRDLSKKGVIEAGKTRRRAL